MICLQFDFTLEFDKPCSCCEIYVIDVQMIFFCQLYTKIQIQMLYPRDYNNIIRIVIHTYHTFLLFIMWSALW